MMAPYGPARQLGRDTPTIVHSAENSIWSISSSGLAADGSGHVAATDFAITGGL